MLDTIIRSYSRKKDTDAYLAIIFSSHMEELEAPFCLNIYSSFYEIEGYQSGEYVQFILPASTECYFEIRSSMIDEEDAKGTQN